MENKFSNSKKIEFLKEIQPKIITIEMAMLTQRLIEKLEGEKDE